MWGYYRPQTKFVKVMFSQVSVCPQGGGLGLCLGSPSLGGRGGLCPGDLCSGGSLLRWGSLSRGIFVLRGLSGGFSVKGGSLSEGSLSRGSLYGNEWVVRILLKCILYPSVSVSV